MSDKSSDKNSDKNIAILHKVDGWRQESETMLSSYHKRWAKNLKLKFGIFSDDKQISSKVRNRDKTFFRKIWATEWRLLASFYNAFLRDKDSYRIEGRDKLNDWQKAGVLTEMVNYRVDQMERKDSLFLKHIWAFQDILDHGICFGKMRWVYTEKQDKPEYILYPVEQVKPDMSAETVEQMRYCIFDNYLTKEELEEEGYDNIKDAKPTYEYPTPGTIGEEKDKIKKIYRVSEVFYKEKDKIKFCVLNENNCVLKPPEDSPYGEKIPLVMGQCFTVAHRLIGEGIAEPLEGPQESYNYNLNMRKDNVALALNKQTIVSRYANVDLKSLVNSRAGGITLADDPAAIKEREISDVTQSSYMEAAADEAMMNEMSGVTPGKVGMGNEQKATVAQINYSESNAKIDLMIAIIGETYWKSFYSILAYLEQRFETDEVVIRIANENFVDKNEVPELVAESDFDFDADIVVNIGAGTVGREFEIRQTMLAIDRAIISNQATGALVQAGVLQPENAKFINITAMMEDLLPKLGKRSLERYFIKVSPPTEQGKLPSLGASTPTGNSEHNDLQQGGLGPAL